MVLPGRSCSSPGRYALHEWGQSKFYQHRDDRAVYFFFYNCVYWWFYYSIPLYILGILEVCKAGLISKRIKENEGCYFLGLLPLFPGSSFWLLYSFSLHGKFLFFIFIKPADRSKTYFLGLC